MPIGALIVDDQDDMRMLVRLLIKATNHGLFVAGEAGSGPEALSKLDDIDPAVVILDQMMPGMSGLETAQLMSRQRPRLTLVLWSAYLDDDLRRKAEEAGIHICIGKDDVAQLPAALLTLAGG